MKKKIGIIIEARTGSKRLPDKILLKVGNVTILEFMCNRLKNVNLADKIIVATTTNPKDQKIIDLLKKDKKIKLFRGSEENVLSRVIGASKKNFVDIIVSLTADCPLIDVDLINHMLELFINNKEIDFLTNAHLRSYPDGMDVQIINLKTLNKSYKLAKTKRDFEHTTLSIRKNLKKFKYFHFISPAKTFWPELGLTLDEKEDYILIKEIIKNLYIKEKKYNFNCEDIIDFLKKNPKYLKLNSNVKRNTYDAI